MSNANNRYAWTTQFDFKIFLTKLKLLISKHKQVKHNSSFLNIVLLVCIFWQKNIFNLVSFKILSQTLIRQHKNNPLCTWISQPWSRHSCRSQSMPSEHLLTFWHHLQSKLSSWLRQVKQSLAILQAV